MEPTVKDKKCALDTLRLKAIPVAFHSSKSEKVRIAILRVSKAQKIASSINPTPLLPKAEAGLGVRRSTYSRNFAVIQLMKKRERKDDGFQHKLSVTAEQRMPLELKLD